MVEAGSRVNWTMLDSQIADKVLFYYAPKILGGLKSLPVAGGTGRQRRVDAMLLDRLTVHAVSKDEFAVEAYVVKGQSLMFTGIVEEVGSVVRLARKSTGARLTVACASVLEDAAPGASIAVNGACVTAIDLAPGEFSADLSPETLKRTNLGDLETGSAVNLERPLRFNGRLDGHFVLGHVDGTAEDCLARSLGGDNWWLRLRVPPELTRYIVSKASVAVDGISLTVAEIENDSWSFHHHSSDLYPHRAALPRAGRARKSGGRYPGEAP